MQSTKAYPASILNPELEITETNWALSYCVKGHVTKEEPEHVFLIMQSHNRLFKREVCYDGERAKLGESGFAIVKSAQRYFVDKESLEEEFNAIVWEHNKDGSLTIEESLALSSNIRHKTWVVDSTKIQDLLEDIAKDAKNPPRFFLYGNESMMERGEFAERKKKVLVTGAICSAVMLYLGTMIVRSGYGHAFPIWPLVSGAGVGSAYEMTKSFLSNETMTILPHLAPATHGKHSCATWAKEKVNALGIPEIDKDLKSLWTDNVIFVPSFRVPMTSQDISTISAGLAGAAKNKSVAVAEGVKNKVSGTDGITISGYQIS